MKSGAINRTNVIFCMLNASGINDFTVCGDLIFTNKANGGLDSTWFWIFIGIFAFLVLFAGFTSGLSIGYFSLDKLSLKALAAAGAVRQRTRAKHVLPLLRRHHLLLVTIVIANAAAVEAMPIILTRITGEILAVVFAVCGVFFGAALFQPFCSQYGLAMSAIFAPFTWLLIGLLFIVAWPISLMLDCLFGEHHVSYFGRSELKALVGLHGTQSPSNCQSRVVDLLTANEVQIIQGALDMHRKVAKDAMIVLENVVMLDVRSKLNAKQGKEIAEFGHSRLPVYKNKRDQIIGLLLVKDLIATDLREEPPLSACPLHEIPYVHEDLPLYDVLREFRTGKSHMSAVYCVDPVTNDRRVIGIITLEDVIEELIQDEIFDEMDKHNDKPQLTRLSPRQLLRVLSIVGLSYAAPITAVDVAASPRLNGYI